MTCMRLCAVLSAIVIATQPATAQSRSGSADDKTLQALTQLVDRLSKQVTELRSAVDEVRAESAEYRRETELLRQELRQARARSESEVSSSAAAPASDPRIEGMEDRVSVLEGKVDDQYQTKVESGSKYRVRMSGMVLFNMFGNSGTVDSADNSFLAVPTIPGGTEGSFGGTLRQSQLRFEVFGPTVASARTQASVEMDFAGGFPETDNGVTLGLMRLRTATLRFDWKNTSLIAGQDAPFISPLSPSSLATVATPALSYAGNLWTWIPQIRVEHRITTGESSQLSLQAGILDPLSGEDPPLQFDRIPQAGEASRQPAFATRVGFQKRLRDRELRLGAGGFYSRQNWKFGRNVDAWAATADWTIPLGSPFTLSGEFYRGRSVAGFGGGLDQSVVFLGPENLPNTPVQGVDSLGGWAQFKYQATPKLEFNVAAGQDNPFADEIRQAAGITPVYLLGATRNRSALFNFIYRPRSNLLFSTEYRRIDTYRADSSSRSADQVNLAIGVLF